MGKQIFALPPLARPSKIFTDAEESYLPAGPPISPLMASYFFYWVTFDAAVGIQQETIGTCMIALLKHFGGDPEFVRPVEIMQGSRTGIYLHLRAEDEYVWLRDQPTRATLTLTLSPRRLKPV